MSDNCADENSNEKTSTDGEVLPPVRENGPAATNIIADITAQISQYTDRPDLLLEVIEKHDPGFIKGMNEEAREFSKKTRLSKFKFGRFQAYGNTILSYFIAISLIGIIAIMALNDILSTWHLIGFAVLYAVTQSGPNGFLKIAQQVGEIFKKMNGGS